MGQLIVIRQDEEPYEFDKIADAVYKKLGQTDKLSIELDFVTPEEIQQLNREYRGVDRVTDVLSFPYLDGIKGKVIRREDFEDDIDDETDSVLIGSVCINPERAKEQAEEYGHSLKREICYLALHGFLHCFGFDHIEKADEEEMTALANEIMDSLDIKR
ncbi:MAG TPA: rRNA maturation RNase YbeY [Clostridiales bacterium]|nr:rRNA maturation RNase YbeY [Clostridiales bacterium]